MALLVFLVLGALAPVQAWVGWMRTERALRVGRSLSPPSLTGPLTDGLLAAGALLMIGLLR